MSRSAFAATFQTLVGVAPKAYLSERRMALARQAFLAGDHGLGAIAAASGFRSFSGFSTAFRNATGVPPSRYGKEVAPPQPVIVAFARCHQPDRFGRKGSASDETGSGRA